MGNGVSAGRKSTSEVGLNTVMDMSYANGKMTSNDQMLIETILQQELQAKIIELDQTRSALSQARAQIFQLESSLAHLNIELNKYRSVLEETARRSGVQSNNSDLPLSLVSEETQSLTAGRNKKQGVIGESSAANVASERLLKLQPKDVKYITSLKITST